MTRVSILIILVRLPVRTALLQNYSRIPTHTIVSAITSQNGTAPKPSRARWPRRRVRLPVRTALLQNENPLKAFDTSCDYQSERHCSKTRGCEMITSDECDYQSERHCSKTRPRTYSEPRRAITSQNGTAPKQSARVVEMGRGAITSQNGTAPKHRMRVLGPLISAITSQNGTAPKLNTEMEYRGVVRLPVRTALLQNSTGPYPRVYHVRLPVRTALLQNAK